MSVCSGTNVLGKVRDGTLADVFCVLLLNPLYTPCPRRLLTLFACGNLIMCVSQACSRPRSLSVGQVENVLHCSTKYLPKSLVSMPSLFLVELANGVKELTYCKVCQFYLNRIHDAHGAGVFLGLSSS